MIYTAQKFDHLLGLAGFSDTALTTHFKLYEGYVTNTNKILEALPKADPASPEAGELRRRFGWEFNGMRLHELYFSSLTKSPAPLANDSDLYKKISADFGSFEKWSEDFKATAATRGIGWTILYQDNLTGQLLNVWINEHDLGHLAGCRILLNIDVFEHAFMIDYNTNRADYITAFMNAIDWDVVASRIPA